MRVDKQWGSLVNDGKMYAAQHFLSPPHGSMGLSWKGVHIALLQPPDPSQIFLSFAEILPMDLLPHHSPWTRPLCSLPLLDLTNPNSAQQWAHGGRARKTCLQADMRSSAQILRLLKNKSWCMGWGVAGDRQILGVSPAKSKSSRFCEEAQSQKLKC